MKFTITPKPEPRPRDYLTLYLSKEMIAWLGATAKRNGVSRSALARQMVEFARASMESEE